MAVPIKKRGKPFQPQQSQLLDGSHPLAQGIVGGWVANEYGYFPIIALAGVPGAIKTSSATFGATRWGKGWKGLKSVAAAATVANNSAWQPTAAITVYGGFKFASSSTSGMPFGTEVSNNGFGVYRSSGVLRPYCRIGSAWADQAAATPSDGEDYQIGFSFNGSKFWSLWDGARGNQQTISGTVNHGSSGLHICGSPKNPSAAAQGDDGTCSFIYIWNRELTPDELSLLWQNPYSLLRPPRRVVVFGLGTSYSLACDAGSVALTGTAAALKASRKLACAAGSVALTGTAAQLRASLPAVAGSVALTGTAAVLKASRKLVCAAGSVTLTGVAATLKATLPAVPGTVTLTGTAALLKASRILDTSTRAVTITGVAATLKVNRKLPCAAGAVVLTGTAATLKASRTLVCAAGSVTLTGTAAALKASRTIVAAPGAVALTGVDATLVYSSHKTLSANPGTVALTGTAATLRVSRTLVCESGSVTISGVAGTLRATLPAAPGSVVITGTAATLRYSRALACAPGAIALTGTPATFHIERRLDAQPGAVAIEGTDAAMGIKPPSLSGGIVLPPLRPEKPKAKPKAQAKPRKRKAPEPLPELRSYRLDARPGLVLIDGTDARLWCRRILRPAPGQLRIVGGQSFYAVQPAAYDPLALSEEEAALVAIAIQRLAA